MLKNLEGKKIPRRTFRTRHHQEWVDITTDDILKGKTVVVFVLPGTFTSASSSTQTAANADLSATFRRYGVRRLGVDEVICISTSDGFVMNEWRNVQKAFGGTVLRGRHRDFNLGMGMLIPNNDLGFGDHSQGYSMLVKDGVIEKMFVEAGVPGDSFEVSDADAILAYMAPDVAEPLNATMRSRGGYRWSTRAKVRRHDADIRSGELAVNRDSTIRMVSGRTTSPRLSINGRYVGGPNSCPCGSWS